MRHDSFSGWRRADLLFGSDTPDTPFPPAVLAADATFSAASTAESSPSDPPAGRSSRLPPSSAASL